MSEPRRTLTGQAQHEALIRKSRFVARAAPMEGADDFAPFLESVADPTANHNCWAWRFGDAYRFSDDGEPGGSAGKPILMAIDGQGMDRVAVVVTRWFGGIKLGVGGLVRAYGGSAAECLRLAPRTDIIDTATVAFALGYAEMERARARLAGWHHRILDEDFGASGVHVCVELERHRLPDLEQLVRDLSRGQATIRTAGDSDGKG